MMLCPRSICSVRIWLFRANPASWLSWLWHKLQYSLNCCSLTSVYQVKESASSALEKLFLVFSKEVHPDPEAYAELTHKYVMQPGPMKTRVGQLLWHSLLLLALYSFYCPSALSTHFPLIHFPFRIWPFVKLLYRCHLPDSTPYITPLCLLRDSMRRTFYEMLGSRRVHRHFTKFLPGPVLSRAAILWLASHRSYDCDVSQLIH